MEMPPDLGIALIVGGPLVGVVEDTAMFAHGPGDHRRDHREDEAKGDVQVEFGDGQGKESPGGRHFRS